MHTAQTANYFLELAKCWPQYICRAEKHTALYTRTHMHTPTVFGHPTPPLDTSSHTNCSGLTIHFCRWQSQKGGTPGGVLSYCSQPSAKHTAQSSVNTAAKMGQWCHWEEREKSAESEKQRERERGREILVRQQSQTGLLLFSSGRGTLATSQSFLNYWDMFQYYPHWLCSGQALILHKLHW